MNLHRTIDLLLLFVSSNCTAIHTICAFKEQHPTMYMIAS